MPPAPGTARWGWAALAGLALVPVLSEVWFRLHERGGEQMADWTLDWGSVAGAEVRPIPEKVRAILRYSDAISTRWTGPGTGPWYFYEIT